MVDKICQSTINPNTYGTSLTVTGAGGFGKTSIVTALCHHPVIKEKFKDGVVFVELGPQATDPSMKLCQLYHLLTGQNLGRGDINHAELEINQLTSLYCRNLLVIIDDVWHIEDAEPIVRAFRTCKIVLTTRLNDTEQYIPTEKVITVGPMELSEAVSLLTSGHGISNTGQISQDDRNLLDELAHDVHLWPLLLSLVRGQLSHNVKRRHLSFNGAIKRVQDKLRGNGITSFDKNNIEKSRKYAVKVCIEATFELITKPFTDKMKSLILWTGIGTSFQKDVLQDLWGTDDQEAENVVDQLWNYGLVQFSKFKLPTNGNIQICVEVHSVISHFIIESMDPIEVFKLSPIGELSTGQLVAQGLMRSFQSSYGLLPDGNLPTVNFLEHKIAVKEFCLLPFYLKFLSMQSILDPHEIVLKLTSIQNFFKHSLHSLPSIDRQINSLVSECRKILNGVHKSSRKLNQNVQKCLAQRNFTSLIQAVEEYCNAYPIRLVAKEAAAILKNIIPNPSRDDIQLALIRSTEDMLIKTANYDRFALLILPYIRLHVEELMQIENSLLKGSPEVELTFHYFRSGEAFRGEEALRGKRLIKLREVAPNYARDQEAKMSRASQYLNKFLFE